MAKIKIALVLGGGAARGLAHLGVLKVFDRAKIPIDMVVGTSMGALIGGMWIQKGHIEKQIPEIIRYLNSAEFEESGLSDLIRGEEEDHGIIEQLSKYLKRAQVVSSTVTRRSYFDTSQVKKFFCNFIEEQNIEDLAKPLHIVTTDILTGEQVVIDSGSLVDAVMASSAIPGAFPPAKIGDRLCIDGGLVNMVPATVAMERGATFIIAVNVSHELPKPSELKRALQIYFRSHEITKKVLIAHQTKFADVVLTPKVGDTHWADFSKAEKMIQAGVDVAEEKLPAVWAMLQKMRRTLPIFRKRKVNPKCMIP